MDSNSDKPLTKPIRAYKQPAKKNKNIFYKHCEVHCESIFMNTWLPEEFAVVGEVLMLKNAGHWEDGWKVTQVSSQRIDEYYLDGVYSQCKHHAEVSDI